MARIEPNNEFFTRYRGDDLVTDKVIEFKLIKKYPRFNLWETTNLKHNHKVNFHKGLNPNDYELVYTTEGEYKSMLEVERFNEVTSRAQKSRKRNTSAGWLERLDYVEHGQTKNSAYFDRENA